DELARRAAIVDAAPDADPPPFFAGEDDAPPLPPAPAIVREMEVISAELWSAEVKPTEAMHGVGIGDRSYRGRACRIDDGDGMALLEPGDVIVALVTHAGHNSVFPIAGAVATELGGALSHPAVLARELGLPAVVGVTGLLERVRTGDLVEVDPVAGVVRVLERPT
ncbi:MAG TPA: PEP-utilizing enzyme, partial [Acidimicrobiales bacterium]|nr:PEP-utilizing enzyme [Acidimicrobiales bacterium]